MPVTVAISTARRAWGWTRKVTFRRVLPESWKDLPAARRLKYLTWWTTQSADAPERIARDVLRLPRWVWRSMATAEKGVFLERLAWMEPKPDCERIPFPEIRHKRRTYVFPKPKGENITAIEYAAAEDYYKRLDGGDGEGLLLLAATLWRERDSDGRAALRRGDWRVQMFDKAEVEARAERLRSAPPAMLIQALLYFAGLKMYIHRVYRTWLFEGEEDEEEEEDEPASAKATAGKAGTSGPDFGWWGVYQYVAEVGVFGKVPEVYQTPLHDICVFLVRKRMEAERLQSSLPRKTSESESTEF